MPVLTLWLLALREYVRRPGRMTLNSVFITVGVSIILVLVAALVGPFFVDWTVYRSTFERYAEQTLGHKVTVLGEADITLLPSPSVTFTDVRVGGAEDPLLVVSKFQMRIELPPLLKGEIRVLDMTLERPHLALSLDEDGRLDWLTGMKSGGMISAIDEENIAFESISVVDGALSLVDARTGETHRLDNGNLEVSARTLAGPYKVDGSVTYDDLPFTLRLATGKRQEEGELRLKAALTPAFLPIEVALDGSLSHVDQSPVFEGLFNLQSIQPDEEIAKAWSAEGTLTASVADLDVASFEYRYGPEDRLISAEGQAGLTLVGKRRFEVRAKAKQLDLDRFLGGGPQEPVRLDVAGSMLMKALTEFPKPKIDGVIALDVPAVVTGSGLVQDIKLDLETLDWGWRIARLSARSPGRTSLALQGDLSFASGPSFEGDLSLRSEQPGALMDWLRQTDGGSTAIQPISLDGRLNVIPGGAALDHVRLELAGSEAQGSFSYRQPENGARILSLSLDADVLDLDELEKLSMVFGSFGDGADLDVYLRLLARQANIRGVPGEELSLEAELSGGGFRIERFLAQDLAGAQIDISGRIDNMLTAPEGTLSGTLVATDLTGLTAVADSLFPDTLIPARLKDASSYLVPIQLQGELTASGSGTDSEIAVLLDGTAGGVDAHFDGRFEGRTDTWHEADVSATLTLEGPDGGQILRQLGFEVLPVDDLGQSEVRGALSGTPSEGMEISFAAKAGEALFNADGQLRLQKEHPAKYRLAVNAGLPDLAPYALLFGQVMPIMAGDIDADMYFDIDGTGSQFQISNLSGRLAGIAVDGDLNGDFAPVPGETNRRVKGAMHIERLDLRTLSEAILGPDLWFSAGDGTSIWPSASFGSPLFTETDLTLDLKVDQLGIDGEQVITGVLSRLRLTPTALRLDDLQGSFQGGALTGALAIRRSDAQAAVSGRVNLDGASLASLVWKRSGRSVANGVLNFAADFEGTGRSIAVMISELTGGGTFSVTNGTLLDINPQAFDHVIRAADAGLDLRDEKIAELFLTHMAAGSLSFAELEGSLSIVGGRMNARNVVVDSRKAEVFGSAEVNFNTWEVDSDFSLKVNPGENAVTGAEPQVGLLFSGPLDAPVRQVDIAPFTAYLTLRAFEQEVERVERLQAEILERDRLLRELKRLKEQRERRQREAEEAAARAAASQAELDETVEVDETEPSSQETLGDDTQTFEERSSREGGNDDEPTLAGDVPQDGSTASLNEPASIEEANSTGFEDRIRLILDQNEEGSSDADRAVASEADSLSPLDPPQTVEDLLARQIGLPEDLGDGGFSAGSAADESGNSAETSRPSASQAPVRIRRRQATPPPAQPRYRTLPSGLVVEIPAN